MNIKEIFYLAFGALWDRKARSALTIVMVLVGSGLMVALNGISAGQSEFVNKQLNMLAPNVLFVSSGQRSFRGPDVGTASIIINSAVVSRISSLPFVQEVVPSYQGQASLESQGNFVNSQIMAMDPTKIYLITPNLQMVDGSTIKPNDPSAIVVGDSVANPPGMNTQFLSLGQIVKATYSSIDPTTGKQITQSKSFIVSAVLQPTGNNQIDRAVIIDRNTGNTLFHKSGKYDNLVVLAQSPALVDTVQKEIQSLYGTNIGIITPKAILQTRQQFLNGNSSFIQSVAFIALLVGAVGIITTLYTSVNERIFEIGTMKAIGAQKSFILSLFLMEAIIIGIVGSTLGITTGIGGAYAMSTFTRAPGGPGGGPPGGNNAPQPHIDPIFRTLDLFNVWILSFIISAIAGLYPAWKASRLSPILALRR
ncbi:MAG TPA: FtsX-like permease family protein [Nitrososphaeraceae archaeon]|nr:FtsX-like permease family protein [Nitrososphaeraceae archaeon]